MHAVRQLNCLAFPKSFGNDSLRYADQQFSVCVGYIRSAESA